MGKAKVKRSSTSIDMTAMCDVSFLLLTFFVLTSTARQPEAFPVDTPASTTKDKLPDTNLGVITIGGEGKVFFGVKEREVRKRMLERMSAKYNVQFSAEDYEKFELSEDFGVPIKNLRQLLTLESSQRVLPGVQTGIPVDSTENNTNELYHWVQSARLATAEITKEKEGEKNFVDPGPMKIAIKADANEKYPSVNLVIETLRNQKQNKFSFVTGLKGNE
ncbi:ExbD/TolR family protein [Sphingobacterium sp. SYP-B4668]|uniref:ExbD/TolR family protein n=1 Tax=Sphingobacterium sp. SYP-B4668 TaxID=2996035 RepID=UPI0022DE11CF|nr:biopolymer transporter ExbD [Sphingobacterium sp. SYP-B4668]